MTGKTDQDKEETKPEAQKDALALRRVRYWVKKVYRPWGRLSARFLDYLAADERRQRVASVAVALGINIIVLTLLATFARVRIFIPNAPSDTIQLTLVEPLPFDLPLRDPLLDPEPEEEEPEIIEEPEPEPEPVVEEEITPEPDPVPEPPEEAQPEPEPEPVVEPEPVEPEPVEEPVEEPEPEVIEEPEPEPDLNLDVSPQLAPEAVAPEPLVAEDPEPAQPEDLIVEQPEPVEEEQLLAEEAEEPLVSDEPEAERQAGVDDILGEDIAEGEDEAEDEAEDEEEAPEEILDEVLPDETPLAEAPSEITGDDMFDQAPSFTSRRFVLPQVALPSVDNLPAGAQGEGAAILPSDSGVVAIFCPEQFEDEDKQKECAGRREIRSGWRPGDSGEDWSRATELLKRDRERGVTGPSYGPVADTLRQRRDARAVRDMRGPVSEPGSIGDNAGGAMEANRPNIGPKPFEPSWTLRDYPEGISEKDIEELRRSVEDDDEE